MGGIEDKTLRQKVSEQDKKLDRILSILENDDSIGKQGLVTQVHETKKKLDNFISEFEKKDQYKKGQMAIIAFIGAGVMALLTYLPKIIAFFVK